MAAFASSFAPDDPLNRFPLVALVDDSEFVSRTKPHHAMMRPRITWTEILRNDRVPSRIKTKKEIINLSLHEFIRKIRLENLAGMYGSGAVETTCEELEEYRAERR